MSWAVDLYGIPEGLPGTTQNVLREASLLPEIVHNAFFFFPSLQLYTSEQREFQSEEKVELAMSFSVMCLHSPS